MNNSVAQEQVLIMTQAGYCDAKGGNGQALRK
jgi:hypothetical protein